MKQMMKNKMILVLCAVAMMMSACGKKSSGGVGVNRQNTNVFQNAYAGACGANNMGRITNPSVGDYKELISNFLNRPIEEIGNISPTASGNTGVQFQMALQTQNGQIVAGGANFKIIDSYTGGKAPNGQTTTAIEFSMQVYSGMASNGQFEAEIGDSYGRVYLKGARNGNFITGPMYYYNFNQNASWVYLGEFSIGTCAITGN